MGTMQAVLSALAGFGLQQRGNEWRCRSPYRPDSDSPSFAVHFDDDEHGAWIDHAGGTSGSLYELATHLGIETPKRIAVESSVRQYSGLADYAMQKGVGAGVFEAAKWREVVYQNRPALEFPTKGGKRWRFLDGNKPKFISQVGYKPCWFGLNGAIDKASANGSAVVICNGEPSVIVAQHFGVAACAITSGESKSIDPQLLEELTSKWQGEIIIALDCDEAGKRGAQKYAQALQAAGAKWRIVDLMLTDGGDVADFCKLHEFGAQKAIEALGAVKVKPPQIEVDDKPLKRVLSELALAVRSDSPLEELLAQAQQQLDRLTLAAAGADVETAQSMVDRVLEQFDTARRAGGKIPGYKTNLPSLDKIAGGWVKGRLYVFLAATGVGKSTVSASITMPLIGQGRGLVIPTETTPENWFRKLVAYHAGVTTDMIEDGTVNDPQKVERIERGLVPLITPDLTFMREKAPTPAQILAKVRQGGFDWIVIDSLSNLRDPAAKAIFETVSAAADLAAELAVMGHLVIATSQVGRNLEGRAIRKPGINDGKGSGRIEENADVLFGLYRHDLEVKRAGADPLPEFPEGTINIECLKHRHRGSSEGAAVQPQFNGGMGVYERGAK